MGIDYNIVVMTGLVSILANCPGISGWKLTSCPSVLEAFKLSQKLFMWQAHILSTSLTVTEC